MTSGALRIITTAGTIAAFAGLTACGSSSSTGGVANANETPTAATGSPSAAAAGGPVIHVTEHDFGIATDVASVPAGPVTLDVTNTSSTAHEVVVFRTDLAESALPIDTAAQKVDEKGAGIEHQSPEAENITQGLHKQVTLTLAPGRYVFLCNLPAHYGLGMHTVVNVS